MKERPILFSGPMVRAILEGWKKMTRRMVKGLSANNPGKTIATCAYDVCGPSMKDKSEFGFLTAGDHGYETVRCPYGMVGDRLWVRETHWAYGRWVRNGVTKRGREKWRFMRVEEMPVLFEEPKDGARVSRNRTEPGKEMWYRRLARFMPKKYARITLEITGVRVERLWEITEEDAKAEGIEPTREDPGHFNWKWYGLENTQCHARMSFETLWKMINGNVSWDANPWVWVVEFGRVNG